MNIPTGDVRKFVETMAKMIASCHRAPELRFTSIENLLAIHGRDFTPPIEKVKLGRMKECYKNAFHLMDFRDDIFYCEGYAIGGPCIPVLHAWCCDKKGNVLEPTWKDGKQYFGVAIQRDFVYKTAITRKVYGVIENWEHGWPCLRHLPTTWIQELGV